MNAKQENTLSMYFGFVEYVGSQLPSANQIPFFMEAYGQFRIAYEGILNYRLIQESNLSDALLDKSILRRQLESLTLGLSLQLMALAEVKKNYSLSKRANYTASDLSRATDSVVKDIAELILRLAQEFMSDLATYEVTTEQLTAFKRVMEEFGRVILKPRQSLSDKANAIEQIEQLFDVAQEKLHLIDKLVDASKGKYTEFYKGYVRATYMTQVDNKGSALRANTKDTKGDPIANVSFEILANARAEAHSEGDENPITMAYLHKMTADNGQLLVQHLPDGTYTALLRKLGYQDKEVIFQVAGCSMVDLDVTMELA